MDTQKFHNMFSDKYFCNMKKLGYKYPDEVADFISTLKNFYYKPLPIYDFDGENLVYIDSKANINMDSYKLLMMHQSKAYGEKAIEEEIISTAKIESIDYSRDSVRNILKGYAPKDDAENRIFGMKKGFDFIADKNNKITEENIFKLYMMAVGDFLDDENKLLAGNKYRHDSVHIQNLAGEVAHTGINHNDLPNAMANLVEFINENDGMNELVKAAIIHFYIAYLHPYFDGNGRMARLVHLWYLVQKGFDNTLFIPFSRYIVKSVKKYYEAYTLIEENQKLTGVIDVTPFIIYFAENVYGKFEKQEISVDVFDLFKQALEKGEVTAKEEQLWQFVVANYGTSSFSTKQLEKDYGNAAYATIRAFVLKFEKLGMLSSQNYGNRVKYKIKGK